MINFLLVSVIALDLVAFALLSADQMVRLRKFWWVFIILMIPIVGALLYLCLGRIGHELPPPNRFRALRGTKDRRPAPDDVVLPARTMEPPAILPAVVPVATSPPDAPIDKSL